jgi:hypothetical protein
LAVRSSTDHSHALAVAVLNTSSILDGCVVILRRGGRAIGLQPAIESLAVKLKLGIIDDIDRRKAYAIQFVLARSCRDSRY